MSNFILETERPKPKKGVLRLETEVLVIGSGAGGAAVARLLSQQGKKVLVLEEGAHFQAKDFDQRPIRMTPRLYKDAGSQLTTDGGITVLQGRAVGGSTLINMGDASTVEPEVLAHWRKHHGWTVEVEEWRQAENWAKEELEVTSIAPEQVNANNRLVLDAAETLGWKGGIFDHFRKGCIGSGYCLVGCAYDAKRGVALNLLPRATQDGAKVFTGMKAQKILVEKGVAVGVAGVVIDAPFHKELGQFEVRAKEVFLCAGAIHSTALLFHSGINHPGLGKRLTLQPQVPLIARFTRKIRGHRGIPQSVFISEFDEATEEKGLGGFRFEPVFGQPETVASGLTAMGKEHADTMKEFHHLAMTLINIPDQPTGHLSFEKDRTRIHYFPTQDYLARARKAIVQMSVLFQVAGAEEILLPKRQGLMTFKTPPKEEDLMFLPLPRLISAHPQGTCAMGGDETKYPLEINGAVRGVKNLKVLDASSFPTSSAHHNTIPIIALAAHLLR